MRKHAAFTGTYWVFMLSLGLQILEVKSVTGWWWAEEKLDSFFVYYDHYINILEGLLSLFASSAEDVFRCPEQFGYYPDMEDCTKYYTCVFGDSHHEKCTGGLFFSVELQTCDWPRNVDCANGMKPGEIAPPPPEELSAEDEVFSPSHTSATSSGDPRQIQRVVVPNPQSVSKRPPYDEQQERERPKNPAPLTKGRPPISRTPASAKVPNPTLPSPTTTQTTTESPARHGRLTTLQDDSGPIPSTVSEDPLYASDDQSKVSSPLDNYDPQQPEYDEAVPPIVISKNNGGEVEIRVPDDGHGYPPIPNYPALPIISDYGDLKQDHNSGNSDEGDSDEDPSYKNKDQRTRNQSPSTNPRRLESRPSDGHSKDPDVVIDYGSNNNKGINDFDNSNRHRGYGTSPPTIFEDYGRFDVIIPGRGGNNNQREKDAAAELGDRNPIPHIGSNNGHSKDTDVRLDNRDVDRPRLSISGENAARGNGVARERNLTTSHLFQEDYRRLHQNGDVIQPVPFNLGPQDNRAVDNKNGGQNTNFDAVYKAPEIPDLLSEKDIRINPNANVDFDTIISSNNGDSKEDEDVKYPPQNSPRHTFDKEYSIPENVNTRSNKQSGSEAPQRDAPKSRGGQREQTSQNDREGVTETDPKLSNVQNRQQDGTHTLPAINSPTKDVDVSYIDVPSGPEFGIYTGRQRPNRKPDIDRDTAPTPVVTGQHKSEGNGPLLQSNKNRPTQPKDYSHVVLDTGVREDVLDDTYDEQYRDYPRGYGEYDSRRPQFTEDYYTNDDPETSTRTTVTTTAKVLRTRPTRAPRRTTTPAPTTTTTTAAPIRIRTRRPLSQVTRAPNKPAFVATTPASPPYRPAALFPTPPPLSSAQKCDPRKCRLPDCRCGGTDIPGEFSPEEIPQIVLLTFDDAVNDLNHDLYNEMFNTGRANPNGCPILGTFYVSHEWTDYGQVQTLYSNGHEIASHSITHSYGEKFSKNQWFQEINGQREILHLYGGVKMEDIRGMRAPFLQIGGNKMFEMLYDANFTYDSSMPVYENKPPFWPYTLDYALGHECMIFPCPTKSFPGLWEVGMIMWLDLRGGRCSMGDACSNPGDEESVVNMLMKNFNRHYKSNRAPFGLFYHSAWFNTQHHRRGFMKFLDEILKNDDVWLVTNWQAIEWIRNPTPSAKIRDFEPFDCRKLDRPPPCQNPTVCNVWYQGGVRYMKSCQPCPAKYPWVGNTGYDSNRRG